MFDDLRIHIETVNFTVVRNHWRDDYYHADPFARLYYLTEGEGEIFLEERSVTLTAHNLYLLPANTPLRLCPPRKPLGHYWCHLRVRAAAGLSLFDLYRCPVEVRPVDIPATEAMMTRLFRAFHDSFDHARLEMQGLIRMLLVPFVEGADETEAERRLEAAGRFAPVLDYVAANLDRPIGLQELADILHLHPTYFSNQFAGQFGVPPRQWILQARIEEAQRLLISTDLPVAEVAARVGYDDQFYFSRIFRKYSHLSPIAYRTHKRRQTC